MLEWTSWAHDLLETWAQQTSSTQTNHGVNQLSVCIQNFCFSPPRARSGYCRDLSQRFVGFLLCVLGPRCEK
jgi:hypothetical protein